MGLKSDYFTCHQHTANAVRIPVVAVAGGVSCLDFCTENDPRRRIRFCQYCTNHWRYQSRHLLIPALIAISFPIQSRTYRQPAPQALSSTNAEKHELISPGYWLMPYVNSESPHLSQCHRVLVHQPCDPAVRCRWMNHQLHQGSSPSCESLLRSG